VADPRGADSSPETGSRLAVRRPPPRPIGGAAGGRGDEPVRYGRTGTSSSIPASGVIRMAPSPLT
jgi:hypothetical protein